MSSAALPLVLVGGDVAYASTYSGALGEHKLLEVDVDLLDYVARGGSLHLKGGGEDALVLTTGDATYAVQLVETSNTVLPTRVLESDASAAGAGERVSFVIEGSVGGVMQLHRVAPSWGRLREILAAHEYAGEDDAADEDDGSDHSGGDDGDADARAGAAAAAAVDNEAHPSLVRYTIGEASLVAAAGGTSQLAAALGDEQHGKTQALPSLMPGDEAMWAGDERDDGGDGGDGAARKRARRGGGEGVPGHRRRRRGGGGVPRAALSAAVQASDAELDAELRAECAVDLRDGAGVRGLAPAFRLAVLDAALVEAEAAAAANAGDRRAAAAAAARGAPPPWLAALRPSVLAERLGDRFRPGVVEHVLRSFARRRTAAPAAAASGGAPIGGGGTAVAAAPVDGSDDDVPLCLDFASVAAAKGLRALRELVGRAGGSGGGGGGGGGGNAFVPLADFMSAWRTALGADLLLLAPPPSLPTAAGGDGGAGGGGESEPLALSLLAGHVLVEADDGGGADATVQLFSHRDLPEEPAARFRALFAVRPRWRLHDLAPFVAPLVGPGRSQDEMILAHTRVTLSHDGSRLFSARR